jgi:hypothetical protein
VDYVYIELLVTATAVQRDLANAYAQSGRLPELGQYFRALSLATTYFFQQIEPAPEFRKVHDAFVHWQELGQKALGEELEAGEPVHSELTRQHLEASQQFADTLAELSGEAPSE